MHEIHGLTALIFIEPCKSLTDNVDRAEEKCYLFFGISD